MNKTTVLLLLLFGSVLVLVQFALIGMFIYLFGCAIAVVVPVYNNQAVAVDVIVLNFQM